MEAEARAEIAHSRAAWIAAINAADADAFVAVLAEDAVWLPWGNPALHTRAEIRRWLQAPFERFVYRYSVDNVRLHIAGAWAAERTDFETQATGPDGAEAPVHRGTYTILWRNTPDGWLIERYIDHTGWDAT